MWHLNEAKLGAMLLIVLNATHHSLGFNVNFFPRLMNGVPIWLFTFLAAKQKTKQNKKSKNKQTKNFCLIFLL